MSDADDVLAHSEDEGEWEDEPVAVDRRPSRSQVLSVRVPDDLADLVFAEVERRHARLSDVVRSALESYLRPTSWDVITIHASDRVRFLEATWPPGTTNPVVTTADLPPLRRAV